MNKTNSPNNHSHLTASLLKTRTLALECKKYLGEILDNSAYILPALKYELAKELNQTIATFKAKNGLSDIQILWILINLICNDLDTAFV